MHRTLALIRSELTDAQDLLARFLADPGTVRVIGAAAMSLVTALRNGCKVIACGNGGSLCDAMHFASELTGRFRQERPPVAALALGDPAHLTCVGNDFSFARVFERQVRAFGCPGDILMALSTSGRSANVLAAARAARDMDIRVIALTGQDGGELGCLAHLEIRVPWMAHADRIQEIHIKILHVLVTAVEEQLFGQRRSASRSL